MSEFLGPSSAESEKSEDLVRQKKKREETKKMKRRFKNCYNIKRTLRLGKKKKKKERRNENEKDHGRRNRVDLFEFSETLLRAERGEQEVRRSGFVKNTKKNLKSLSPTVHHLPAVKAPNSSENPKTQIKIKSNQIINYTDFTATVAFERFQTSEALYLSSKSVLLGLHEITVR